MLKKTSNTCLAVVREKQGRNKKGKLVFAADRRISWGMSHHQVGVRPKVVKRNGVILAGTGVSYLCDLITELVEVPPVPKDMDGFSYVHHFLIGNIKSILITKGFGDKDGNLMLPNDFSAVILLGVKGELFELSIDGEENYVSMDAIDAPYGHGCGGQYAMGSLKTTENLDMNSEARLQVALSIAAALSPGCDSNIDIIREWDEDTL